MYREGGEGGEGGKGGEGEEGGEGGGGGGALRKRVEERLEGERSKSERI